MAGFRQPEMSRSQHLLWSTSLEDAIPSTHPVRVLELLLSTSVFAEEFKAWESEYDLQKGKPPYHPRYLAGLYLYGMMETIRSSRRLEAACFNRIDFRWLMEGQSPDHSTIADFVNKHKDRLRGLFKRTVELGIRSGLIQSKTWGVDGTMVQANASKESVRTQANLEEKLEKIEARINELEKEWEKNEQQERSLWGEPDGSSTTSEVDRQTLEQKRERLRKALDKMVERDQQRTRPRKKQPRNSVTDPESRHMPIKEGGMRPAYNAQVVTDETAGMIVGIDVTDEATDQGKLMSGLDQGKQNVGTYPEQALADSAYNTGPDLKEAEAEGIETFLPDSNKREPGRDVKVEEARRRLAEDELTLEERKGLPKNAQGRLDKELFVYDAERNVYRCPMNKELPFMENRRKTRASGELILKRYGSPRTCEGCPLHAECCQKETTAFRNIDRDEYEEYRERLRDRMSQEENKERYRKRSHIAETPFGHFKGNWGFRQLLRVGLEKASAEIVVLATAFNLKKLMNYFGQIHLERG